MGRKPKAPMLLPHSSTPERMNLSSGKSEPSPNREQENGKSEVEQNSTPLRRKKSGFYPSPLRRSQRKTSALVDIEAHVEHTIVSDNEIENDKTDTQLEKVRSELDENLDEPCLKEKVDYILQRVEALGKITESLQAKVHENIDLGKTPSSASAEHRMFTGSQNKLEALTEENRQLTGKLERVSGKLEVFEKQCGVLVEILEGWKDVVMVSNLSKSATEAAVNASVQAIQNVCASYGGKRKRQS